MTKQSDNVLSPQIYGLRHAMVDPFTPQIFKQAQQ